MAIPFACPHCGKAVVVEDHFAGQSGPCAACGKLMTVPAPTGAPGTTQGSGAVGVLGVILGIGVAFLMLCVGLGGLMYGLLMPAIGNVKRVSQQASSINHLKQITLALQNYEAVNGSFPPAFVTDSAGKPLYSWRVLILPYLQETALYERFDKSKAWDDPANIDVSNSMVKAFRSPADDQLADNGASYVSIVGRNTAIATGSGRKLTEFLDGTSNTILVLEVKDYAGSWAAPSDPTLAQFGTAAIVGSGEEQLHGAQANGGILLGAADGTVRQLDSAAAARVIVPAAITVNDGQVTPVQ